MKNRKGTLCALATTVMSVTLLTGCFGESVLSAGAKVAGGQMASLTANEIKILNQTVLDLLAGENPGFTPEPLTDAQANAVSSFLQSNSLNTFEDFETLEEMIRNNPESIQGLDELEAAFADQAENFDEENFDFDALINKIFGASGGTGGVGTGGSGGSGVNSNAS